MLRIPDLKLFVNQNQKGILDSNINQLIESFSISNQLKPQEEVFPGFQNDDPQGKDHLDIQEDVDAFTSLITSKDLDPPLSIGLFGDWGTGKSFFMNKMKESIKEYEKWAKKKIKEKTDQQLVEIESKKGDQKAIINIINTVLTDPKEQAKQIQKWAKYQNLWTFPSLEKIYDKGNVKIEDIIKNLIENEEKAVNTLQKKIEAKNKDLAKNLAIAFTEPEKKKKPAKETLKKLIKAREEEKYCPNIAQIEFNAWHYIDTSLWANLITNIFEKLNVYIGNLSKDQKEQIKLYKSLENTRLHDAADRTRNKKDQ